MARHQLDALGHVEAREPAAGQPVEEADRPPADPEIVLLARNVLRDTPDEKTSLDRRQSSALHEQLGEGDQILELVVRQPRGRGRGVDGAGETCFRVLDPPPEWAQNGPGLDAQGEDATAKQRPPGQPHSAPGPQDTPTSHLKAWTQVYTGQRTFTVSETNGSTICFLTFALSKDRLS